MSKRKRALLAGLCATIAAVVIVGLVFGFDSGSVLTGIISGIGAYVGVIWGNRRARETDAYREQWLNKRKKANQRFGSTVENRSEQTR